MERINIYLKQIIQQSSFFIEIYLNKGLLAILILPNKFDQ